ncbi:amidohydrolase family protein [Methylomonas sp. EFPC1]|uniref:amidohydrolase family protein n=1 Tax=Methylomonas sp. EFPC1 TaxID=2812647 RepID=UPI001966EA16|nr:amidohydrolase family protein [Methylomonas sp. EFPC1]QSB01576.1 amidohydrolase family protein [Methylomonas sp. EFPC1]
MKSQSSFKHCYRLLLVLLLTLPGSVACAQDQHLLIAAARVFDGYTLRSDAAVLISDGKVARIDSREAFNDSDAPRLELGDATLLPGFIELHAHLSYQHVPTDTVLRHGITTVRDVGGPLHQPYGGDGSLRLMTSGPIITAPAGYPIPNLGETDIAMPVADEQQARQAVRKLVAGGAVVIKVALEPGGEAGAPWSGGHTHAHSQDPRSKAHDKPHSWPMLAPAVLAAIVDEAHLVGRRVAAHLAEPKGAQLALDAGVDEWAHAPCDRLPDAQLQRAAAQQVRIVGTIDTLSKCPGLSSNVRRLAELGAEFLYGAEIAHPDIPWGIDGQELLYLQHLAGMAPLDVMRTATSKAGQYLNTPLLGSLLPGAPADLIAVKGDPTQKLKLLEYPDLVMSGGKLIINYFGN